MSIEELVLVIQEGATNRMEELWEAVQKFVAWKARKIMLTLGGFPGIEVEDLIQSGYFAVDAAVRSYRPECGTFLTWLGYHLKNAFAETTGYRSDRERHEPLNGALSMDALIGDDEESGSFMDMVPDPQAEQRLEDVQDSLWNMQLRAALEEALNEIPKNYSEVVRLRFFGGKSLEEISQKRHITSERVRQLEREGLRHLKKTEQACNLYPFWEYDFYSGTGLQCFRNKGASVQEQYLIARENARQRAREAEKKRHHRRD